MLVTPGLFATWLGTLLVAGPAADPPPSTDPTSSPEVATDEPRAPAADAPTEPDPPTEGPDAEVVADAERMYRIGEAHFAAADYAAAIETWTAVLSHLPNTDAVRPIRLDLLYNIASAHEQEYEVDDNPRHLRQAMVLFQRYVEERSDPEATADAQRRLDALKAKIEEIEARDAAARAALKPKASGGPPVDDDRGKRDRLLGISLIAGGSAVTVAGVVMLAVGTRFRPNAEDQVADASMSDDEALRAQADAFIDDETRKGTIVMAVGGTLGGVGLAAAGVGIYYLVRGQRARGRTARVHLDLAPGVGGAVLMGRF